MSILSPWIVGIDLGPRCDGALVFATWLRRTSGIPVFGLHIIATHHRFSTSMDAEASMQTAIHDRLTALGLPLLDRVEVTVAEQVEDGLCAALGRAEGLVLGRARVDEGPQARLGRATRRVLRQLAAPVVVVPAELTAVGDGPVLLATDLSPASAAAGRWAAAFADEHERPLAVVHVQSHLEEPLPGVAPPLPGEEEDAKVAARASAWLAEHGLAERPLGLLRGDPVEQIAEAAASRAAALVVVGSRRLASAERLFAVSTSAALAARCACPVAVVPPG